MLCEEYEEELVPNTFIGCCARPQAPPHSKHFCSQCSSETNQTTPQHLTEYDLLDTSDVAGADVISRGILQIQKDVKRNPTVPGRTNLQAMPSSTLDETGGVITSQFDECIERDRERERESRILRQ